MQMLESWRLVLKGQPVEIALVDVRLCLVNAAVGLEGQRDLMQVLESWRLVLRGLPMEITLEDVRVCARDGAAFVTCTEVMEAGDSRGRYALLLLSKFYMLEAQSAVCTSRHPAMMHAGAAGFQAPHTV